VPEHIANETPIGFVEHASNNLEKLDAVVVPSKVVIALDHVLDGIRYARYSCWRFSCDEPPRALGTYGPPRVVDCLGETLLKFTSSLPDEVREH
jgi:hypothetical protein